MQQVLSENYYCVFGWMREMGLKGLPLQIYAIIYGFCQAKGNAFYGSLSYLEEFTGYSRPSVIAAIKQLIDEGFIDKEQEEYNQFIVRNKYICKKFPQDEKFNQQLKDLTGVVKNLHGGSKETLPNNIYNNINNNIKETNSINTISKEKRFSLTQQMSNQSTDGETPSLLNNQKINPNGSETRGSAPTTAASREEREQAFREQADKFIPEYGRKMIDAFCDYWTEFGGKKMRFEKEKTWELKRRLQTWKRNDEERKARYQRTATQTTPDNSLDAKEVLKNLGL